MRRPLFETGLPQVPPALASIVAAPNSALSVLDLRSLNDELQSFTRFVTLYAANQSFGLTDILEVAWREGTSTPLLLSETEILGAIGVPTKILDRFPLRGDAELLISNAVGDSGVIWGYFELEGSSDSLVTDRPLQPGALVSPFTYVPVVQTAGVLAQTDVHAFDEGYFDIILLDVVGTMLEGVSLDLVITDGTNTVTIDVGGVGETAVRVFDGIPMGGLTSGGGISVSSSAAVGQASIWGSFLRIS
jgi:hypothetical protein